MGDSKLQYGLFVNAVVSFVVVAAAIFFFVVKPMNRFMSPGKADDEPKVQECPHCLSSIPAAAKVCAHCTRSVARGARKR